MHTTSTQGSYSRLNCKCTPGYSCTYYKRIQAIVTLNATVYDFNNNIGGVRTNFIAAMAAAANVTTNHVTINGVVNRNNLVTGGGARRRMLSLPSVRKSVKAAEPQSNIESAEVTELSIQDEFAALPKLSVQDTMSIRKVDTTSEPSTIRVFATVANAGRLNHLEHKLEQHAPGLHLAHRWERHSSIKADKSS
jgi:hypothetical protein